MSRRFILLFRSPLLLCLPPRSRLRRLLSLRRERSSVRQLLRLLKSGAFLWVEYPAPGGNGAGFFSIEYPTLSVFCYRSGVPVWHDMTLSMTAQEVTST